MTEKNPLDIIVLAAGKGSRMHSALPKVLHSLAGRPMLSHVIATASALDPRHLYVVLGHESALIQQAFPQAHWHWVLQKEQLGTGHAVQQVLPQLAKEGRTLIMYADVPLLKPETLENFINTVPENDIGILTAVVDEPKGLGRIIRDQQNHFVKIIEEKDAKPSEKLIKEINSGIYIFPNAILHQYLHKIDNANAQQEYYLPSILDHVKEAKINIYTSSANQEEILGINDRWQLMQAERVLQKRIAKELTEMGVTVIDANRFDLRGTLIVERDVTFDVNVVLSGEINIDVGCYIGPNTLLKNVRLGKNVHIKSNCVIEDAVIADNCIIGPFAHIRPGCELAENVHVGNFVELKKAQLGKETKVNHLSYIGDAIVGEQVNIGAGTITCNYDGQHKHVTKIGDHAFIGSNSSLVAPLSIGEKAVIGAGSVIAKDAPPEQLTLARSEQKSIGRWWRKKKKSET